MARKPLSGTVAANVQAWGTGALNIDATRIGVSDNDDIHAKNPHTKGGFGHAGASVYGTSEGAPAYNPSAGRWPANVALDGEAAAALDQQSGITSSVPHRVQVKSRVGGILGTEGADRDYMTGHADSGGASRFFLTAEHLPIDDLGERFMYTAKAPKAERPVGDVAHPTVKPLALMRWLVRLVTPPGGTVLEPFAGSGTTVEAAIREGFNVIAIEREADYLPLIEQRIARAFAAVEAERVKAAKVAEQLDLFADAPAEPTKPSGRWPANVAMDRASAEALNEQSGTSPAKPERVGRRGGTNANPMSWTDSNGDLEGRWPADPGGGASRFFFVADEDFPCCAPKDDAPEDVA